MHTAGLKAGFGKNATYVRGAASVAVTAVWQGGDQDREYATELGDSPEETSYVIHPPEQGYCGFLVAVAEISSLGMPQRGDKLVIGTDEYPLQSPAGLLPWRYADLPHKVWFWLHTKLSASD